MRQTFSPSSLPICVRRAASSSLLVNMPAYSCPRATIIAPVRVARSIINSGLKRFCVYQSASANTKRPSASVFNTSMVWPDIEVTISPGRWALPSGIFSTSPSTPTTFPSTYSLSYRSRIYNLAKSRQWPLGPQYRHRSICLSSPQATRSQRLRLLQQPPKPCRQISQHRRRSIF